MAIPLFTYADTAESAYILNPIWQQWFEWRATMVTGYTPWFDPVATWHRNTGCYQDAYAGYNNAALSPDGENAPITPDMILTDVTGRKLYIPYGYSNGIWPQFALDVKSPKVIAYQKNRSQTRRYKLGHKVLLLDDVNLELRLTNGQLDGAGNPVIVPPPHSDANGWAEGIVELCEEIRTGVPDMVIIHNSIWFTSARQDLVDRQILAADFINCERGFGDPALNPQTYEQFMAFIDHVHGLGRPVIQDEADKTNLSFRIACFLLMWRPKDLMNVQTLYPDNWDLSMDVDFGSALAPRQRAIGLDGSLIYTRQFTKVNVTVDFTHRTGAVVPV